MLFCLCKIVSWKETPNKIKTLKTYLSILLVSYKVIRKFIPYLDIIHWINQFKQKYFYCEASEQLSYTQSTGIHQYLHSIVCLPPKPWPIKKTDTYFTTLVKMYYFLQNLFFEILIASLITIAKGLIGMAKNLCYDLWLEHPFIAEMDRLRRSRGYRGR